ncbi:MAG: hypothetical protein JSV30_06310 [Candidatus Omnitrophota bacterium]|nr:MAG: hypothetical protein JSV30_06310 [Candidatus Omnitrophota bacterium]
MPRIILISLAIPVFLIAASASAEMKDARFQNRHGVRIATSDSDDSFYVTRAGALVDYSFPRLNKIIKILPFFEYQHNLDNGAWWRKEAGVEVGSSFFNDCFYWGASFQHIWQQEENYAVEANDETSEWESRFVITPPIKWWLFKDKLTLKLFDEYTYDFERGQPTINEVGVSFDWQISEKVKMPLGWRHIDRIHDFDSDLMEVSVLFSF